MKSEKLIELIRYPEKVSSEDIHELDELVGRYPFFQTARILYLKVLHLKAGSRFRNELKQSTVHITDHKQLFRYLNQQLFFEPTGYSPVKAGLDEIVDERIREIDGHIEVTSPGIPAYPQHREYVRPVEDETVRMNFSAPPVTQPVPESPINRQPADKSPVISNPIQWGDMPGIVNDYNEPPTIAPKQTTPPVAPAPSIPLPDLSGIPGMISEEMPKPAVSPTMPPMDLDLEEKPVAPARQASGKNKQKKNNQLIEQFIQTAPVMPKIKATTDNRDLSEEKPFSPDDLFSETLAKIYVKQGLYERAIQTYIKLSLKYPEKSVYFADRIEQVKQISNNQK
ncbi:MAG: hypothetical protein K2I90_03865 [Odoribacter sp.]|nr:hypothetical protein [Odoribacter sp.]